MPVALVQRRALADPMANAEAIEALVVPLRGSLVVLPEATMAPFGTPLADVAEPLDGPFATRLRRIARDAGVVLVAGMFEPADVVAGRRRVHNTLLVTDGGQLDACYRKIHLYDAFGVRESDEVARGHVQVCFEAFGTTIGLGTCYDVRFAEQFTALGRRGAQIVCLPASWGDGPRKLEQWQALTTARAMDAQAFLLACDQPLTPGDGSNPLGVGHSRVVGPLGECVAEAGDDECVLTATLDLDAVTRARTAVPIL